MTRMGAYRKSARACAHEANPPAGSTSHDRLAEDALFAIIAEQRVLIAQAAGVTPSKVTIRLGH